ncbi:MinD/ParA family protein [Streptomyces sp. NPDC001222]|uniref:MinD/ParA family ATP-binding protein n=1 Tax=Streptomyces sp. NPDC001222 TaxID=3364548 RepID=UPI00369C9EE7
MRRLVVVGSVTGAPGVTTTALAVAAAWPSEADGGVRPVVVEADVSGGDLMIRFGLPAVPSLLDVAAAAGQSHPGSLLGAMSELPFGVRAVIAVPGRGPCREAVRLLAGEGGQRVLLGDDHDRGTVLLDVGRLSGDVAALLAAADQMVLVTRGGAESLTHVSACGLDAEACAGRLTLAVVGPCPYPAVEIADTLGIQRVLMVPWDAKSVTAMNNSRPGALRTLRLPPLMAAARRLARQLAGLQQDGTTVGDVAGDRPDESNGSPLVGQSGTGRAPVLGVEESGS